ncbi:hypothetical protein [Tabrizicola sp.]|uniref:hypothetical protein n=1 Tax=Tabrizicola sp. TaxID=2005166 RepID=UPI0025D4ED9E|nr:hypothetical protein [Tabrizicola sp.]MDK2773428.1 hypothetical protein [Tabrizicola sp.]
MFDGLRTRLTAVAASDGWARSWLSRATAAGVRAFLVMILIVMPSVILPGIGSDTKQVVALVALFGGALVFFEYHAVYPSLIEFRDGAPYNRIRFLMMLTIVVFLSAIVADREASTTVTRLFHAIGLIIGSSLDFPYSPVRLASYMLADGATALQIAEVKVAAATAYLVSLFSLALFVIVLKLAGWPSTKTAFNVWVNLPTFEPTAGGDVVDRLVRDSYANLTVGFLLPFVIPAIVAVLTSGIPSETLTSPQTLIWTMALWAYLPAALVMRAVAMARIADMIRIKRAAKLAVLGAIEPSRLDPDDDEDDDL